MLQLLLSASPSALKNILSILLSEAEGETQSQTKRIAMDALDRRPIGSTITTCHSRRS